MWGTWYAAWIALLEACSPNLFPCLLTIVLAEVLAISTSTQISGGNRANLTERFSAKLNAIQLLLNRSSFPSKQSSSEISVET
jgi:hypothetical protein